MTEAVIRELHPLFGHQEKALLMLEKNEVQVMGMSGGRGSSKSDTADQFVIQESMRISGNFIPFVRRKQEDANIADFDHFCKTCPQELIAKTKSEGTKKVIYIKPMDWDGYENNLSKIVFTGVISDGLQNPDNVKGEFGGVVFPELSEIDENVFLQAITSCRSQNGRRKIFAAFNPVNKHHWINRYFPMIDPIPEESFRICDNANCKMYGFMIDEKHPHGEIRHVYQGGMTGYFGIWSKTTDNKALPADYIEKTYGNMPASWIAKFIDGKSGFEPDGRGVYERDFKSNVHVRPTEYYRNIPVVRAFDPGLYPAVLWMQFLNLTGRWQVNVLMECAGFNVQYGEFLQSAFQMQKERFDSETRFLNCGDPALKAVSAQTKRSYLDVLGDYDIKGMHFVTDKTRDSKSYRVDIVRTWMKIIDSDLSSLNIDPSCEILIEGFEGGYKYKWHQSTQKLVQEPIKDPYYSGVQDCLQYGMTNFSDMHGKVSTELQEEKATIFRVGERLQSMSGMLRRSRVG
jgi:hypothetical protein